MIFHHYYTSALFIGSLFGSLPFIFKNNEYCYNDKDCPYIMKCCYDGYEKYCCSPNKYLNYKSVPIFVDNKKY